MLRDDACATGRRHSILVVDDDAATNDLLTLTMRRAGHEVRCATNGLEALRAIDVRPPDLVILEVALPELDGLEIVRRLRRRPGATIGVIVVSRRTAEHHRLAGFAAGADDYVVKPFSPRELTLRAAGILRRLAELAPADVAPLEGGPLLLDPTARRVTCAGTRVDLTRIEYGLLLDLMSRPGLVRTRGQLVDAAWGAEHLASGSTVTVHIQRLRMKLSAAGCDANRIHTVRGIGYRLEPSSQHQLPVRASGFGRAYDPSVAVVGR